MRIKRISDNVGNTIATAAVWMLGMGAVLAIWGGVWLVYLFRNAPDKEALFYIAAGLLLTGIDLLVIGMLSGRIGRAARDDDASPEADRVVVATPERRS